MPSGGPHNTEQTEANTHNMHADIDKTGCVTMHFVPFADFLSYSPKLATGEKIKCNITLNKSMNFSGFKH